MREMRRAEAEFSVHLFSCKNVEEALSIAEQWLAKRQEIQRAEQVSFEASWAELKSLLTHSPKALHRKSVFNAESKPE